MVYCWRVVDNINEVNQTNLLSRSGNTHRPSPDAFVAASHGGRYFLRMHCDHGCNVISATGESKSRIRKTQCVELS